MLDIGGGTGAMSIGICEKIPHLEATVFDLPENIEKAKRVYFKKRFRKQNQMRFRRSNKRRIARKF